MIKISAARIREIVDGIDGKVIEGVRYDLDSGPKGLVATFTSDADDEEAAMANLKKHLKATFPAFMFYIERNR